MKRSLYFPTLIVISFLFAAHPAGAQWTQTGGPEGGMAYSFAMIGTKVFAGMSDNGVFESTNNGFTWMQKNNGLPFKTVFSLLALPNGSGGTLYAGTNGAGVYRSTDDGDTWTPVNSGMTNTAVKTLLASGSKIYAATFTQGIFSSSNGGTNWTMMGLGSGTSIRGMALKPAAGTGNDTLFVCTGNGGMFRSINSGGAWVAINNGLPENYINAVGVAPSPSGVLVLAGTQSNGMYMSSDAGDTWTAANSGLPPATINMIHCSTGAGGTSLFVAAGDGSINLSTDGGGTWSRINNGIARIAPAYTVWTNPATSGPSAEVYASLHGPGIFRSTNRGSSWTQVNTHLRSTIAISQLWVGDRLFVGSYGAGIFLSTDFGATWSTRNDGLTGFTINRLMMVATGSADTTLFAATAFGVFRSTNMGMLWEGMTTGIPAGYARALASQPGIGGAPPILFAGIDGAGVYRSTDMGTNWAITDSVHSGKSIQCLFSCPAAGSSGYMLFAGSVDKGVTYTTDLGAHWTDPVTGIANKRVYEYAAIPVAGGVQIYAVSLGGGVSMSTDYGANWNPRSSGITQLSIYCIASIQDGQGVYHLYAGSNSGGVFHSGDLGATWSEVNGGLTNLIIRSMSAWRGTVYAGTNGASLWRANAVALPVELLSFTGRAAGSGVELQWRTASEVRLRGFAIERGAAEGTPRWETISFVAGILDGLTSHTYSFTDRPAETASYAYRLKQIDHDGAFEYSGILTVRMDRPVDCALEQIAPHPCSGASRVSFTLVESGRATLVVCDVTGRRVASIVDEELPAGSHLRLWDSTPFPSGMYFLRLETGATALTRMFTIMR
jgi:hypothetical protein